MRKAALLSITALVAPIWACTASIRTPVDKRVAAVREVERIFHLPADEDGARYKRVYAVRGNLVAAVFVRLGSKSAKFIADGCGDRHDHYDVICQITSDGSRAIQRDDIFLVNDDPSNHLGMDGGGCSEIKPSYDLKVRAILSVSCNGPY